MKNKTVVHLTSMYPDTHHPYRGIFIARTVQELSKKYQISVISPVKTCPGFFKSASSVTSTSKKVKIYRPRYFALPGRNKLILAFNSLFYIKVIQKTLDELSQLPDIVHAHSPIQDGIPALHFCRKHSKKFILHLHGSDIQVFSKYKIVKDLIRPVVIGADQILVNGKILKKIIEKRFLRRSGIKVIGEGVNEKEYFIKSNIKKEKTILFVGNLVKDKGIFDLVKTYEIIAKKNKGLTLRIIGQGAEKKGLRNEIVKRVLEHRIELIGPLKPNKLIDEYNKARVTVLPSYHEGFGIVLIESLACGTPVVATRCGGPEDIITKRNGMLVPIGKPRLLASAIKKVINHRYNSQILRKEIIERYSFNNYISKIFDAYRDK